MKKKTILTVLITTLIIASVFANTTVSANSTSGSADWQEDSATVGDTIHADFTWTYAHKHWTGECYACMYIYDPDGTPKASYIEEASSTGSHTLSCTANMEGTWLAEIKVWDGSNWLKYNATLYVGPSGQTSGSADWQEDSATVGDTIHADFTWTYAHKHWTGECYACMYIYDPDGTPKASYIEEASSTGSHTLSCTANMEGTWLAEIKVWDGSDWLEYTDNLTVNTDNSPPNTPSTPSGPSSGDTGVSYTYSTSATDPDGDNVYYKFDWGDGSYSNWVGPYPSGGTGSASHSWSSPGTYSVKAKARDTNNAESGWSTAKTVTITQHQSNNPPLEPAVPEGPMNLEVGEVGTYGTFADDPDYDQVYYKFNWGDGTYSNWVGPYDSGEMGSASKSWNKVGTYTVKAKAKDVHGDESGWSSSGIMVKVGENNIQNNYAVLVSSAADWNFIPYQLGPYVQFATTYHAYVRLGEDLGWDWQNNIEFLTPFTVPPPLPAPWENQPTKKNLERVLTQWLSCKSNSDSHILIYMCGVCTKDGEFRLSNLETISASTINNWLVDVQYDTLVIVIEGDRSGRLIKDLSGERRIIVTSTNEDGRAYYTGFEGGLEEGAVARFTRTFFNALATGHLSYGEAWEETDRVIPTSMVNSYDKYNYNALVNEKMSSNLDISSTSCTPQNSASSQSTQQSGIQLIEGSSTTCEGNSNEQNMDYYVRQSSEEVLPLSDEVKQIPLIEDSGNGCAVGTDEKDDLPMKDEMGEWDGNLALSTYPGGSQFNGESASLSENLQEVTNQQNSQITPQYNNEQLSNMPSIQNNQQISQPSSIPLFFQILQRLMNIR